MRNWLERHELEIGILLSLVAVTWVLVYGTLWSDRMSCQATTAEIGYRARWSVLGNCQIEVEPGRWLPLSNYRYLGNGYGD